MRWRSPICLEPIEEALSALEMPCSSSVKHVFHRSCILEWLGTRNSCPVCRHLLPTDQPPQESAGDQATALPSQHEQSHALTEQSIEHDAPEEGGL
jgi:hypothetical protein